MSLAYKNQTTNQLPNQQNGLLGIALSSGKNTFYVKGIKCFFL